MNKKTPERKLFENTSRRKNRKLATLLKEIRLDNSLTLPEVAKFTGFSWWTIQKYERCVISIPVGYLFFCLDELDHDRKIIKLLDKL